MSLFAASIANATSTTPPVQEPSPEKLYFSSDFGMWLTEKEIFERLYKGSDRGLAESAERKKKDKGPDNGNWLNTRDD